MVKEGSDKVRIFETRDGEELGDIIAEAYKEIS